MKLMDEPQRIRNDVEEIKENIDIDVLVEEREKTEREEREKRDNKVMAYLEAILMEAYYLGDSRLSKALMRLNEPLYKSASFDFDLYSLIVILHQNKEMDFGELEEILSKMVRDTSAYNINIYYLIDKIFKKRPELKGLKRFLMLSSSKKICFDNGNEITDFIIKGVK